MARVIAQRELRNDNAKVIAAVAAGETFIITRNGTPVAELRPLTPNRRRFVPRAEFVAMLSRTPHIDWAQFREDIDSVVDQSIFPRYMDPVPKKDA